MATARPSPGAHGPFNPEEYAAAESEDLVWDLPVFDLDCPSAGLAPGRQLARRLDGIDVLLRTTKDRLESGLERLETSRDAEGQRLQRLEGLLEAISAAVKPPLSHPASKEWLGAGAFDNETGPGLQPPRRPSRGAAATTQDEVIAESFGEPPMHSTPGDRLRDQPAQGGHPQDRLTCRRDSPAAPQGCTSGAAAQGEQGSDHEGWLHGEATSENSGASDGALLSLQPSFSPAADLRELKPRAPDVAISQRIVWLHSRTSESLLDSPGGIALSAKKTRRRTVHPDSVTRTAFDVMGLVASLYDACMLPLDLAFDMEFTGFIQVSAWLTFAFWLFDMLSGFFLGYHSKGRVVLDLEEVARRYLRRGFVPSLAIVCLDAVTLVIAHSNGSVLGPSYGKLLRLLRLPRGVRAFHRLIVFSAEAAQAAERVFGAYLSISTSFISFFAALAFLSHGLACAWAVVGASAMEDHFRAAAELQADLQDPIHMLGDPNTYTLSFYWVVNLLLAGNIVIGPVNMLQRFFLLLNLVVGLLFCSLIVGVISDKMVAFRMSQASRRSRVATLRQYLLQSHVPYFPAVMMERVATGTMMNARERLMEEDVALLRCFPPNLRDALHGYVFRPAVCSQSFVRACEALEGGLVENICRLALKQTLLSPGEFAFQRGDEALGAYMVYWGACEYCGVVDKVLKSGRQKRRVAEREVAQCEWLCELALFCQWDHNGSMRAKAPTELLSLKGQSLVAILQQSEYLRTVVAEYSSSFCRAIQKHPEDFVNELELPVKHEQVVQLMRKDQRAMMSEAGLEIVKRSAASWTSMMYRKDLKALLGEVAKGKCDLLVQTRLRSWAELLEETVLRVVCLCVLRLEDDFGRVFMQLGTFSDGSVVPEVQLPGVKILAQELPVQAVQRVLDGPLAGLKDSVTLQGRTVVEEIRESKSYRIQTKYVKHVASFSIAEDWQSRCHYQELELPALDQSLGLRAFALEGVKDSTPVYAWVEEDSASFSQSVERSMTMSMTQSGELSLA